MNKIDLKVAHRIRGLREKRNLTREKLAEYADISVRALQYIENSERDMTTSVLIKICNALNTTSNYILYGENDISEYISTALNHMNEMEKNLCISVITAVAENKNKTNCPEREDGIKSYMELSSYGR